MFWPAAAAVLGVSFGGMVAQEFAVTWPGRVERLALACTSAGGGGGSSYPLHELPELPAGERAAAQLKLADSRWDERWLQAHPADRALAGGLTAAGRDQRDPAAGAAAAAQLQARAGHDVWDRLGAISCPTLVGYGSYDEIAPVQNSAAIASRPRSRAARLRRRAPVLVPGPGRAAGIRGIPARAAEAARQLVTPDVAGSRQRSSRRASG